MYHCTELIGHLGSEPKVFHYPDGSRMAKFSVASNRKYNRSDGKVINETIWFSVEAWGNLAEVIAKYLHTGSKVMVVGRLVPDQATGGSLIYDRRDGEKGASFVLRADTVRFLDSKGKVAGSNEAGVSDEEVAPSVGVSGAGDDGKGEFPF